MTGCRRRRPAHVFGALALVVLAVACTRPTPDDRFASPTLQNTSTSLPAAANGSTTLPPPVTQPGETAPVTTVATGGAAVTSPGVESTVPAGRGLDDISLDSVPADVLVPTSEDSLNETANPINGARGGERPDFDDVSCAMPDDLACLVPTLDLLGFDVTGGSADDRVRRVRRAIAVVQLDAGFEKTGEVDDAVLAYLGLIADDEAQPDETRVIGSSRQGRPITAVRYGNGERVVMVVGQTHGDEEAGLRVLLRARQQSVPDGVTLWVIPTMNPDGGMADSRTQANGANLNRLAVSEPEQQAVFDFALDIEPSLTVWYHQNYGWVGASGASPEPARHYQELSGLGDLRRSGDCAKGFMWCPIDDALGSSSILVELPDVVTPADVQVHADALLAVAAG